MANRSLFNQFTGAFIRQMGREVAHDSYRTITGKDQLREIVSNGGGKLRVPSFGKYLGVFFANFFPLVSLITLIKGIRRQFSKIKYVYYTQETIYKADRRYRGGEHPIGKENVEHIVEISVEDCSKDDVRRYRKHGRIYILIGLVFLIWKCYNISVINTQNKIEHQRNQQIYAQAMHWSDTIIVDNFNGNIKTFRYIYPACKNVFSNELMMVCENKSLYLYATGYSVIDEKKLEIKLYKGNNYEIFDATNLQEEFLGFSDDAFRLALPLQREVAYGYRYKLSKELTTNINIADSALIRSRNNIYHFNFAQ